MAGDWLKWTKGLPCKMEVLRMASQVGVSPMHVAGTCMVFWEWLDDNVSAADVDSEGTAHVPLRNLRPDFLDAVVELRGFAAAMAEVGWLHFLDGALLVPDFATQNPRTAKTRAFGEALPEVPASRLQAKPRARTKPAKPESPASEPPAIPSQPVLEPAPVSPKRRRTPKRAGKTETPRPAECPPSTVSATSSHAEACAPNGETEAPAPAENQRTVPAELGEEPGATPDSAPPLAVVPWPRSAENRSDSPGFPPSEFAGQPRDSRGPPHLRRAS